MYTDIHKNAEVNDITDSSLKDHALFQILHIQDIGAEDWFRHLTSRGSLAGFSSSFTISRKVGSPISQLLCQFSVIADLPGNTGKLTLCHIFRCVAQFFQEFFCCVIVLSGWTLVASRGFLPPVIRVKPAHCSKAFGPSLATFRSSLLV